MSKTSVTSSTRATAGRSPKSPKRRDSLGDRRIVRLGLITDIHEHVADLKLALAECDRRGVDRIICLGDVFQTGEAIHETVSLLAQRDIAGVWGNRDFGLCSHPSALVSSRRVHYVGPVLDYLAT